VPAGRYDLEASLDLKPFFGRLDHIGVVRLEVPGEKILDQRLAQLGSEDAGARRAALIDLRYFRQDGDKVFPLLMKCVQKDPDPNIRMIALSVMMAYPDHVAKHEDVYIGILFGDDASMSEKSNAAMLLSRYVPVSDKVGAVLEKAWAEADENMKLRLRYSLENYRERAKAEQNN
jgi:hypothetical protein